MNSKVVLAVAGMLVFPALGFGLEALDLSGGDSADVGPYSPAQSSITVDVNLSQRGTINVPEVVTIGLRAGEHDTGGVPTMSVVAGDGGSLDLWMYVTSDGDLDGMQWDFEINGADASTDLTVTGKASPSFFGTAAGAEGFGSVFCAGFGCPTTYFAIGDFTPSDDVLDTATGSELLFRSSGYTAMANLQGATVVGYELAWDTSLPVGTYTVSLSGGSIWTSADADGILLSGPLTDANFVLTVVPEPATALLLLGALPLLRRRRSL
jgi:hypothetical protein